MTAPTRCIGIALLAAVAVFPLAFAAAMDKGLTHDEHQHIAAGALLARYGLLPYRDFPYFHTPNLVFVYAALFRLSNHLVIAARSFCEACTALTAGALFATAWHAFGEWRLGFRVVGSTSAVALLVTAPVFLRGTGNAWNQQPSVLFAFVSILLILAAPAASRPRFVVFGAGLCLGLSVGFRLTFAPIALPILGIIYFSPQFATRSRVSLLGWFAIAAALALIPLWWLFLIAPEQTLFGNFEFPSVNIIYRFATGEPRTMTLAKKLRFMMKEVGYPNWALLLATVAALSWYLRFSRRKSERFPLLALAALLPFVFAGSLAPSPLFVQYFYAPLPFVILAIVFAVVPLADRGKAASVVAALLAGLVLTATFLAGREYGKDIRGLFFLGDWKPLRAFRAAQTLRALIGAGPVLTAGPTDSLEAGLEIYPAFSTGPFAWRVAPFIEASKRHRLGIVGPEDLTDYLKSRPPQAVLLGYEPGIEEPFERVAKARGFREQLVNRRHLWLSP